MKRFPTCEKICHDRILSIQENKSKIIFENPQSLEICCLQVDNCAIKEGPRCDYAMTVEHIVDEFYIELKGQDIRHAFQQLEATIKQISSDVKKCPKICFIISTRVPLTGPEIQVASKQFKSKFNAKLEIKNLKHTCCLKQA
ncbi:MAG: hypothetical protein VKJ24_11195 [Synechococcales bacterium]|nr:hypothetical protein [Synechococcales bacterium]